MDFPNIPAGETIGLDYETSGLQYWQPDFRVFGVAIAFGDPSRGGQESRYWDLRETPNVRAWLSDNLSGRLVVAQNAQYDYQCTRVLGIDPRSMDWYCTMVHECLIDEHRMTYDLASICGYHGIDSQKKVHLESIRVAMGWRDSAEVLRRLSEVPAAIVAPYGASDALEALQIWQKQTKELTKQNLWAVSKLEMETLPVLADMSWGGVRVDLEAAHAAIPKLDIQEQALQKEVEELTGGKFNVNSTPQIRDFFNPKPINKYQWELIDGTLVGPTKTGKGPSLGQDALRTVKHPLAAKILALRKTIKLRDTFVKGHIIGNADGDGYIHTSFNQTRNDADAGTVTGRLSSTDPALQQITNRDKINAEILRSMFLADEDETWMRSDCSQIDFRMAAHLINDPGIIAKYKADPKTDYHQAVSDLTGIPRNATYAGAPNTKTLNLSLAFGAGAGKIAHSMGMPYTLSEYKGRMAYLPGDEAKAVFDKYHKMVPGVKGFSKQAEAVAKNTEYVKTMTGRRLRFPRGHGAHKAAGLLFQAFAADTHKFGLVMVDRLIREEKLPARLMLSVHDEMAVSMPNDMELAERLTGVFTDFNREESPLRFRVPILASTGLGANWWLAGL